MYYNNYYSMVNKVYWLIKFLFEHISVRCIKEFTLRMFKTTTNGWLKCKNALMASNQNHSNKIDFKLEKFTDVCLLLTNVKTI